MTDLDETLKQALEIAGWPEWSQDRAPFHLEWVPEKGAWHSFLHSGHDVPSERMAEPVAHALIEKHLKDWLAARVDVCITNSPDDWGVSYARQVRIARLEHFDAPTLLSALAAAVVAVGKDET